MEGGYQWMLLTGDPIGGDDDNMSPVMNSEEAFFNGDMSFLRQSYEKPLLSSLDYQYRSSYSANSPVPENYGLLNGGFQRNKRSECSKDEGNWRCRAEEKLKMLKLEPTKLYDFVPKSLFGQLPELQSLEQAGHNEKRLKLSHSLATSSNPFMLESMLTNFQQMTNYFAPSTPLQPFQRPPRAKLPQRDLARIRRNTLSDKARSLQKLLPWDKKMDMATIYEETYKYIKYLKAQIAVLQSMPAATSSSSVIVSENPSYGGLEKLNRQQLLEVLVNSPAAQTILYSNGCCVYSLEQLFLFKDIAEKNFFIINPLMFS